MILDAIAMSLALGTGVMAVRMTRRHALLNREHTRLMEERAAELERFGERLTHDLRTPLAVVAMSIDYLRRLVSEPSPKFEETIARADRSLKRALVMMEGIFHFARSAGKPLPGACTDLGPVVQGIVEDLATSNEADGAVIEVEPFARCRVGCEVGTLTSILENLLRNAVKHTRERHARRITLRASASQKLVRIEIQDTGPGLAPELVDRVFEPYVRGTGSVVGLGLGLATVKRFCEANGGSVRVRSRPGEGCTFTVVLPEGAEATSLPLSSGQ